MTVVRYAELGADRIVNLASPRYLPEVSRSWVGARPWHHPAYEPLRDLIEQLYVDGFNQASGHYDRLEADLLERGFRNPVMLSAGRVTRRRADEIPPEIRGTSFIACEYLGGSRVWVAQRHGLVVPAIVNDHTDVLPRCEVLESLGAVRKKFTDPPSTGSWTPDGVYVNGLPYVHLGPNAYSLAEQSRIRRRIIARISRAVREWLDAHD